MSNQTFEKANAIYVTPDETIAQLDSIMPSNGMAGKSATITIYGSQSNFLEAKNSISVYLKNSEGSVYAQKITSIDSQKIEVEFDFNFSQALGFYTLYLYNAIDGNISMQGAFELLDNPLKPSIKTVSPDTAEQGKLLEIEVTAANLDFKQGSSVVYFKQGNESLSGVYPISWTDSSITVNQIFSPDRPVGYYDMLVYNNAFQLTMEKENAIFITEDETVAVLESCTPENASQGDKVILTISGSQWNINALDITNDVYLKSNLKSVKAFNVYAVNSETLAAEFDITYAHPTGLYNVELNNELDGTTSIINAFEISEGPNTPHILEVTPDSVTVGQTLDVKITAENLDFTQGSNIVHLQQGDTKIEMNSSSATSKTVLHANISVDNIAPTGAYNISIYNTTFDILLVSNYTLKKEKALYLKSAYIIDAVDTPVENSSFFYPNPAKDVIFLTQPLSTTKLFDINGRKVLESSQKESINISELPKGVYLIQQQSGGKTIIQKIMIE